MSKSYFANILGRLTALGLLGFMVSGCAVVPGRDLGSPVSLALEFDTKTCFSWFLNPRP